MDLLKVTPDSDMIEERYHPIFIHGVFASYFNDVLEYFTTYLQPRFEYRVVSTYDKAVEYLEKKAQFNREMDVPDLPAFILNPTGDFELADANTGAKQLFRFPNFAPGMLKRIYEPIYQDQHLLITPGFTRFKGQIELIMLLNSFYEYCDLRVFLIQIFGGNDRFIYPRFFNSYIILPEELINYRYTNEYTGVAYKVDWLKSGANSQLIRTTNQTELVYPCTIKPIMKLAGLSDGSERYGGTDRLAKWRLVANIDYEVEFPTFLILESDYLMQNLDLSIGYGSAYSAYSISDIPIFKNVSHFSWDFGLDATSNSEINLEDATSIMEYEMDYEFQTRYYHIITAEQADSTADVDITIPEQITDIKSIVVSSKYGVMWYGSHYLIVNDGLTLRIRVRNVDLTEGQIIELFIYAIK